jgi:hypothetical protein
MAGMGCPALLRKRLHDSLEACDSCSLLLLLLFVIPTTAVGMTKHTMQKLEG